MPTFNREEKLFYTIKSVLAQTFENFELLICDDGSTDNSQKMVKAFTDKRIRWFSGTGSGGPATPRNRGISEAQGEWLAFLDSDDQWLYHKLEKQLEIVNRENVKAVCTNAFVMRNNQLQEKPYFNFHDDKLYKFDDIVSTNYVICSSMLIHHSIAKKMAGFPEERKFRAIEDYVLWLSASMMTDIYYLNEPLIIYRDEPYDSIRGLYIEDERIKHRRVIMEVFRRIKNLKTQKKFYAKSIVSFLIQKKML